MLLTTDLLSSLFGNKLGLDSLRLMEDCVESDKEIFVVVESGLEVFEVVSVESGLWPVKEVFEAIEFSFAWLSYTLEFRPVESDLF